MTKFILQKPKKPFQKLSKIQQNKILNQIENLISIISYSNNSSFISYLCSKTYFGKDLFYPNLFNKYIKKILVIYI